MDPSSSRLNGTAAEEMLEDRCRDDVRGGGGCPTTVAKPLFVFECRSMTQITSDTSTLSSPIRLQLTDGQAAGRLRRRNRDQFYSLSPLVKIRSYGQQLGRPAAGTGRAGFLLSLSFALSLPYSITSSYRLIHPTAGRSR